MKKTLTLDRIFDTGDATIGILYDDTLHMMCYTLEDEHRRMKIKGETRIPKGTYKIDFRKVESPMTKKYRNKFDWFTYHLMLHDVPGFNYVYLHIGNTSDHTNGCILVGETQSMHGSIGRSTSAFEKIYKLISSILDNGHELYISITDNV